MENKSRNTGEESGKQTDSKTPVKQTESKISGNVNTMTSITDALDALQSHSREERLEELQSDEAVRGGRLFSADNYRYFQGEKLLNSVDANPVIMKDAQRILRSEALEELDVRLGYQRDVYRRDVNSQNLLGTAILRPKNRTWYAMVTFDRDRVRSAECNNWKCGYTGILMPGQKKKLKICAHELAALLVLQDYLKTHNVGDATTVNAMRFLDAGLKRLPAVSADEDMTECTLVPTLVFEDNMVGMSFRYGRTGGVKPKLFKVKDLRKFYEGTEKHEVMEFGSTWAPVLGEQKLNEAGTQWYGLIRDRIRDESERSARALAGRGGWYESPREYQLQIKDVLPLYGFWLDRAVSILRKYQHTVDCIWREYGYIAEKQTVKISGEEFRPRLTISPLRGMRDEFEGVRLSGQSPDLYQGKDTAFCISDGTLTNINPETARLLKPLTEEAENGQISASIGRTSLPEFYHKMLPELRKIMDIEETGAGVIRDYVPPEGRIVFYLDTLYGSVLGRVEAWYGSECCQVSELVEKGSVTETYRDQAKEAQVAELLLSYLPKYDPQRKVFFSSQEDEIYQFLLNGVDRLMEAGEVHTTQRFRRLGVKKTIGLNMGVTLESNLLDLSVSSSEVSEEELLQILLSYQMKKKYYRLKNGNFLSFENQEQGDVISRLGELMDSLHMTPKQFVQGKMKIPAYRALYLDRMLEDMQGVYADRDRHFRTLVRDFRTGEESDYEIPEALKGVLRRYQKAGYRWLRMLDHCGFGGILADDMGLGKTIQVIAVFASLQGEGKFLVVSPASLVYNWGEELRRFAPELKVSLITGTQKERRLKLKAVEEDQQNQGPDVLVTSYDLLKRDIDAYENIQFRIAVIDEAQFIKNSGTAAAKAVKLIHADTRFALTGTPIENRLSELWSIFDYLMPGFLYPYETFRSMFETPIVKNQDEETAERLRRMVTPFVLRRLKKEVLKDLPDKIEEVRYAGMEKDQQKLYDAQVVLMKKTLESQDDEEFNRNRIQILAELTRIRQICCDPVLCFESYKGSSAKREACLDLIRNAMDGGHKALVFSQFKSMLNLLEADLVKEGIPFYKIVGETPKERRIELVNSFNEDDTPVFLISLKAGGTGLNLTGADIVIHYDPWWNMAAQNQATDRAHRIGQTKVVNVYRLIMKGTIEEKILDLQEAKQKLSDDILSAEGVSSSRIDRDELLALLQ